MFLGQADRGGSDRGLGDLAGCFLGHPEVQNFGLSAAGDKNVSRFDISMDDSFAVSRIERVRQLDCEFEQQVNGQWLATESTLQDLAFEQFHGEEISTLVDFIDVANVRMIE